MEKIQSVFGKYAERLQVLVDASLQKFEPVWFKKYFDWSTPTSTLTYVSAIGRNRIEAAASVVDRKSPAPTRSRQGLEKLSGTVPAIKESFRMNEEDYRNFQSVQQMNVSDQTKRDMLMKLLFDDVKKAGDAPLKRVDIMCLQALSLGKVQINVTNNPDGIITNDIDLLMPSDNFKKVAVIWSTPTTSTPITDIKTIVIAANAKGIKFEKMLMTLETFWKLQLSAETVKQLSGFFRVAQGQAIASTLEQINQYLNANFFPIIEIVNEQIGIEKDGLITTFNPWNANSVSFIPSGKLGLIHNAFAIEQMEPVAGLNYATYENVLIKKYRQHNPWGEFTDCELNAFPGVEAIDRIYILDVETAA